MLEGHLDILTSTGFVEGWATNRSRPLHPSAVAVLMSDGREVARGLAHLYRQDLADVGLSAGWCAFRLRLTERVSLLRESALQLIDAETGNRIIRQERVSYHAAGPAPHASLAAVIDNDPTILLDIGTLAGCGKLFDEFVEREGCDRMVRTAFIYMLGRPADGQTRQSFGERLRSGKMKPLDLLRILADSGEYQSRPRRLVAPTMPGFPFKAA